eukprot:11060977-Lingulodinium_polyedra.AAC.1
MVVRRVECADCDMRTAAVMECVSERWNAFLRACLSSSHARVAQKCARTRIPLLRRRACRNLR